MPARSSHRFLGVLYAVCICIGLPMGEVAAQASADLVTRGATWKYRDDGSDQGSAWREPDFNDVSWKEGPAELGYGDDDVKTVVSFGADKNQKYITTYFRHVFNVTDPAQYGAEKKLALGTVCDDGCVVYLNGQEVWRANLPDGPVDYKALAKTAIDKEQETQFQPGSVSASLLRKGRNVIAVEVHQQRPSSSDVSFNLFLSGSEAGTAPTGGIAGSAQQVKQELDKQRKEALRAQLKAIRERITADKAAGSTAERAAFAELEEDYAVMAYSATLPGFLRQTPASFAILPNAKQMRFVAFGDFGKGTEDQKQVAAAMRAEHKKKPFDFGMTLGDNFYGSGMYSIDDERWTPQWEALYTPMKIKFYASLGNHDWYSPDSPAAEILYSLKSPSWHMPTAYYSYTAGIVEFFVLNTEVLTEKQLMWLEDKLDKSTATWKIVYGHHPIYSGSRSDNPQLIATLLPVLRGKADAYLAGHDHVLAHLKPEDGIEFFVSGGGGASKYEIRADNPRKLYGLSDYGYLTVDVTPDKLHFRFVGADGRELYAYTAPKRDRKNLH